MLTLVLTTSNATGLGWDIKRSRGTGEQIWAFETMTADEEERYLDLYAEESRENDIIIVLPSEKNQPDIPKFARQFADVADEVIVHK
jgi:hypothetical protein